VTIFGVAWDQLTLAHVERFLAGAGREPLTWEAKGKQLRSEHVTKNVAGFANAAEGGYLILGFELVGEEWKAAGAAFTKRRSAGLGQQCHPDDNESTTAIRRR
jgi:predicted HTH transcriptional regulator